MYSNNTQRYYRDALYIYWQHDKVNVSAENIDANHLFQSYDVIPCITTGPCMNPCETWVPIKYSSLFSLGDPIPKWKKIHGNELVRQSNLHIKSILF